MILVRCVNKIYNQKTPEFWDFLIHFLDNETFHLFKIRRFYDANEEGHDFHQILKLKSP